MAEKYHVTQYYWICDERDS